MIDIKVLRAMAAAGATVEMILAAVEAAQNAHQDALAKRRESDANRQTKRRRMSRDITLRHVTSRDSSTALDDVNGNSGIYTSSSLEGSKKEEEVSMPAKRKRAIPDGFVLSAAASSFAEKKGWGSARIQSEFNRFCDHARANGRKQIDWDAAWRNWVTSPFQKPESVNGNHSRTASDVLREMCEGTSSGESEDTGRLLPPQ